MAQLVFQKLDDFIRVQTRAGLDYDPGFQRLLARSLRMRYRRHANFQDRRM